MSESNSSSAGAPAIGTLVFLVFLVLKLAEVGPVAQWSWWWVTSPLWISAAIFVLIGIAMLVIGLVARR